MAETQATLFDSPEYKQALEQERSRRYGTLDSDVVMSRRDKRKWDKFINSGEGVRYLVQQAENIKNQPTVTSEEQTPTYERFDKDKVVTELFGTNASRRERRWVNRNENTLREDHNEAQFNKLKQLYAPSQKPAQEPIQETPTETPTQETASIQMTSTFDNPDSELTTTSNNNTTNNPVSTKRYNTNTAQSDETKRSAGAPTTTSFTGKATSAGEKTDTAHKATNQTTPTETEDSFQSTFIPEYQRDGKIFNTKLNDYIDYYQDLTPQQNEALVNRELERRKLVRGYQDKNYENVTIGGESVWKDPKTNSYFREDGTVVRGGRIGRRHNGKLTYGDFNLDRFAAYNDVTGNFVINDGKRYLRYDPEGYGDFYIGEDGNIYRAGFLGKFDRLLNYDEESKAYANNPNAAWFKAYQQLYNLINSHRKGGIMIKKHQQGGQLSPEQQELQFALLGYVVATKKQPKDENEIQMIAQQLVQLKQQNPQQYSQLVQLGQQAQAQKAEKGAKLNYLKSLKGQCPDGEELVYFKKGGMLCSECQKKENKVTQSKKKMNAIEEFKAGCKVKKHQEGGLVDPTAINDFAAYRKKQFLSEYGKPTPTDGKDELHLTKEEFLSQPPKYTFQDYNPELNPQFGQLRNPYKSTANKTF